MFSDFDQIYGVHFTPKSIHPKINSPQNHIISPQNQFIPKSIHPKIKTENALLMNINSHMITFTNSISLRKNIVSTDFLNAFHFSRKYFQKTCHIQVLSWLQKIIEPDFLLTSSF